MAPKKTPSSPVEAPVENTRGASTPTESLPATPKTAPTVAEIDVDAELKRLSANGDYQVFTFSNGQAMVIGPEKQKVSNLLTLGEATRIAQAQSASLRKALRNPRDTSLKS